jgi:hypothetical protein
LTDLPLQCVYQFLLLAALLDKKLIQVH